MGDLFASQTPSKCGLLTLLKVRRAIKGFINDFPQYERLLPHVKGSDEKLYMLQSALL